MRKWGATFGLNRVVSEPTSPRCGDVKSLSLFLLLHILPFPCWVWVFGNPHPLPGHPHNYVAASGKRASCLGAKGLSYQQVAKMKSRQNAKPTRVDVLGSAKMLLESLDHRGYVHGQPSSQLIIPGVLFNGLLKLIQIISRYQTIVSLSLRRFTVCRPTGRRPSDFKLCH